MENLKESLSVRPYDTPAVVYEAALVAHAATSTLPPNCPGAGSDLLDPFKGK